MKKNLLLIAAAAILVLAGCSSEDFAGEEVVDPTPAKDVPINFGSFFKAMTRNDVTGAEAAKLLNNAFVVSGYKGSATATPSSIVFDNYKVVWGENTANTTASNTKNWDYVGVNPIKHATDNGITRQTIKYWDYSQSQYDFIAWSTGSKTAIYEGTPTAGQVLVSAIDPNAAVTGAYTFTGKAADLSECYIADLVTVKKAQYGNDPVTFRFRQLGTKVRIGIYETVPGYSIKDVKFYSAAASNDASTAKARLFTTTANEIFTEGTYTVSFPTVDKQSTDPNATDYNADNNQAHVTFVGSGTQSTIVDDWGGLNYTIAEEGEKSEGKVFLGRTSNTASFAGDAEKNYYEIYLPNQTGTNLNLRVDYTLESIDGSGEKINVRGATAQVPLIYTQWKPGFAYTYLFKISDKTNGYTGVYDPTQPDNTTVNSEPAGLYPITFDAVVVNAEEGNATQETITLVSTPSITTYQKGSTVVNDNEYQAATGDIFVTVNDGGGYKEVTGLNADDDVSSYYTFNTTTGKYTKCGATETAVAGTKYYQLDPVLANSELQALTGKAALYTIPDGKTEAEVIDALQMQDDDAATGTIKGRSGLVLTEATAVASIDDLDAENEYILTNSVEFGADGNAISVETDQALRFKPAANTTYAFVYTKTDPTTTTDKFQPVTKAVGQSVSGLYRYALKNAPAGDVKKDVTYFTSSTKDAVSVFLGQTVDNLYLDNKGTIASGYAETGTTYYYTTDKGMSYKEAHNVNYADFAGATDLYTLEGTTYTLKTDATPQTGTAYYQQTGAGTEASPYVYTYCVILPQQTNPAVGDRLKIIDPTAKKSLCTGSMKAVAGMTYFDMYTQNDGVYYTKIIKVE